MRLTDIPALLIEDIVRKLRRIALAGAVIAVCAVVILIEGLAASRLALEPLVGPVFARLILVGAFLLIAGVASYFLLRDETKGAAAERRETDNRVAVIAEAISLGYSLARDFTKPQPGATNGNAPAPPPTEPAPDRPAA